MGDVSVQSCTESKYTARRDLTQKSHVTASSRRPEEFFRERSRHAVYLHFVHTYTETEEYLGFDLARKRELSKDPIRRFIRSFPPMNTEI
jgi:hypothetical protein